MSNPSSDPASICPLCGAVNSCGLAAGNAACWCFAVRVDREAMARIPANARDRQCLCAACAAASDESNGEATALTSTMATDPPRR